MNQEDLDKIMRELKKDVNLEEPAYMDMIKDMTGDFFLFASTILKLDKEFGTKSGQQIISAMIVALLLKTHDTIDESLANAESLHNEIRRRMIGMDNVLNK